MPVSLARASLVSSRWWLLAGPAVLAVSSLACSTDGTEEPNGSSAGAAGSGVTGQAGSGSSTAGNGSSEPEISLRHSGTNKPKAMISVAPGENSDLLLPTGLTGSWCLGAGRL